MKEKILTYNIVKELGLDKVSVITADMFDGYTSIGSYAFYECRGLTSVTIPNSVTSIGNYAFAYCSSLTSLSVEAGNTVYDSRNNCNAIIETSTNTLIFGCQNTTIPNSVTSIESLAFADCTGLTSVTIPNSVTSIGERAFSYCYGLASVTIPNSVTRIGERAFSYCYGLTSVTIPNSVTNIREGAFHGCSGLTSVTIPDSITSIGSFAFDGCINLTSVIIRGKRYRLQKVTNGKCKAYKAFRGDMTCRDFQYEEGKTYEYEGKPKLCEQGFHASLNLSDVFNYYYGEFGRDIVVHEVKLEGVSDERNGLDSKVVAKKIKIGKRIL